MTSPQEGSSEVVCLEVWKEGAMIAEIDISKKGSYLLGRNSQLCDIVLEHLSCSRQHARLEHDDEGLTVEDLGSAQGSKVNGEVLAPRQRRPLQHGSSCEFALSSRQYVVRAPALASKLSVDDKKARLWSSKRKTDWSAAAATLGNESRASKFLALMGAEAPSRRTTRDEAASASARQAAVFADLTEVCDKARDRGRAGLG